MAPAALRPRPARRRRGPSAPGLRERRGGDRGDASASDGSRFSLCTRVSRATDRNRNAAVSRQRPVPGVTSRPRHPASGEGGQPRGISARRGSRGAPRSPGRRENRAPSVLPGVRGVRREPRALCKPSPPPRGLRAAPWTRSRRGGAPPHPGETR